MLTDVTSTLEGSEVTFQCNEGLFPSSEITIVCTSEERWSPDPQGIVCGEQPGISNHGSISILQICLTHYSVVTVTCSPPGRPRNGFLGDVTSSTITFGCNEGYSPQGTMTAVCVATDTWSPNPAQLECVSITTGTCTDNYYTEMFVLGLE